MSPFRVVFVVAVCSLAFAEGFQGVRARKDEARADDDSWWPAAEFGLVQKIYDDCSSQPEMGFCLKSKALNALSRAVEQVMVFTDFVKSFEYQWF